MGSPFRPRLLANSATCALAAKTTRSARAAVSTATGVSRRQRIGARRPTSDRTERHSNVPLSLRQRDSRIANGRRYLCDPPSHRARRVLPSLPTTRERIRRSAFARSKRQLTWLPSLAPLRTLRRSSASIASRRATLGERQGRLCASVVHGTTRSSSGGMTARSRAAGATERRSGAV